MIDAKAEGLHLEHADPQKNWMENLCFFGFDEANQAGFIVHMKNRPNEGIVEIRAAVRIAEATCTFGGTHPLNGSFRYPGFEANCIEPGKRWRLKISGQGKSIADAGGVIGLPITTGNDTEFSYDVEWSSPIEALDWAVLKDSKETDSAGTAHYDQGGQFSGEIMIGGHRIAAKGLAYRDHSWGPRNFMKMDVARYIGFVTADMRTYFDGLYIDHGAGKEPVGFSYTMHDAAGQASSRPEVSVLEGEDWERKYDKVSIAIPGATYTATTLWHVVLPLIPERYLSNVAMVHIETEDGRSGFGIVERGRLINDEELVEMLDTAGIKSPAKIGAE